MYNRYIPQPDGTYRRNRIQDCPPQEPVRMPEPEKEKSPVCDPVKSSAPSQIIPPPCHPDTRIPPAQRIKSSPRKQNSDNNVGNFLKQLLPKNFDTGDLLVVLLLLLMSGECAEDQNTALLTLALYLFL